MINTDSKVTYSLSGSQIHIYHNHFETCRNIISASHFSLSEAKLNNLHF
jgi:thymidylate synthase